ncbi:hypothetical protein NQF87_03605 [Bombella sp. TMW 2.2559]|uniref:Uncharacterized protein n=1 Tax=Bombella dulcis TaxID=2967339 RepID=A0ABT3WGQ7_9PROT|nr:hypothetical protein [Bombella dulcis]MCX5616061.1 hypothetical protein [Bombella dulcis]
MTVMPRMSGQGKMGQTWRLPHRVAIRTAPDRASACLMQVSF